jgi:hypothetical protein
MRIRATRLAMHSWRGSASWRGMLATRRPCATALRTWKRASGCGHSVARPLLSSSSLARPELEAERPRSALLAAAMYDVGCFSLWNVRVGLSAGT